MVVSRAAHGRGILLLEVILAIAILTLGMAAIGGQIFQARKASQYAARLARAVMLAESVITALDARLLEPEQEIQGDFVTDEGEQGSIGYFGVQYLPWAWRVLIDPTREEGMFLVTVEIYYHPDPLFDPVAIDLTTFRRGDGPAGEDVDDMTLVYSVYALRAEPGTINLVEEFGIDPEELAGLAELLPGLDFDPTEDFDPDSIAGLLRDLLDSGLLPPGLQAQLGPLVGGSLQDLLNDQNGGAPGGGFTTQEERAALEALNNGTFTEFLEGLGGGSGTGAGR